MNLFSKKDKEDKILEKIQKKKDKHQSKYIIKNRMKRRIKNSQTITNIKNITEEGIIELKTGEVASMLEVKAIDLSLTSKQEKQTFFSCLKSLYQIKDLNLKCYKLDEMINLNDNKVNLYKKRQKLSNDEE